VVRGTFNQFFSETASSGSASSTKADSENEGLSAFRSWFEALSYTEQICWAFNVVPSELVKVYWRYSFNDMKYKLRVSAGEAMANHAQFFETLAKVVSNALGGGSKSGTPKGVKPVQTADQALQQFAAVFG
jgi:hypothetical protein